jgi:sulfonate transport system permease protein
MMKSFAGINLREAALVAVSPLLLLAVWIGLCWSHVFPEQILVSPWQVFEAGHDLFETGELGQHLQNSLHRLLLGFVLGGALGLAFGILMGGIKAVERLCAPTFHTFRQIPTIAFIPLLILIFGVEETFKIVVVAQAAFFPVTVATIEAVKGIPRSYFDVAQVYRLSYVQWVSHIVLPATVPPILTGFRISLGRSWMVLVAAELLAAESGIGQMMEMGRQMFRIDVVMVGVILTGVIGFTLDWGFRALESHLIQWKTR